MSAPSRSRERGPRTAPVTRGLAAGLLAWAAASAAQVVEQPRAVIAAGGGSSADAAGTIRISGTFSEPVTGALAVTSAGGRYAVAPGFWADARAPRDGTFRDQFENAPPVPAHTEQTP